MKGSRWLRLSPYPELTLRGETGTCKPLCALTCRSDGNRPPEGRRVGPSCLDCWLTGATATAPAAVKGGSSSSSTPSLLTDDLCDDRLMLRLLARTRLLRSSGVCSVRVLMSSYQAIIVSWLSARKTQLWPRCIDPVCRPLRMNLFEELPSPEWDPNFCSGR